MTEKKPDPQQINLTQEVGDIASGGTNIGIQYRGFSLDEVKELLKELQQDKDPVWNGEYPYPGLVAFQENDAKFFFGRERLVGQLLERIQNSPFVVIAGPSGSGKSSVARAGLFHALRDGQLEKSKDWILATMQPKSDPFEGLAAGLERATKSAAIGDAIRQNPADLQRQINIHLSDDKAQRLVLLIDQFEETFTQTADPEIREVFINLLTTIAHTPESRVIVVLTLRSDFISHCVAYPKLRELMNQQLQLVGAMEPHDLATAISKPALVVGAEIDPQLVEQIMKDMKGEPGALPLMSFALRDLFEVEKSTKGKPMDLLLPEYVARGGLEKALERHAESVFEQFDSKQKELTKSIFSNLITVGQGRVDTRRTATFAELVQANATGDETQAVINALAQEGVRLITVSTDGSDEEGVPQGNVTIAHERLIDAWPWLRELVDENRDMIELLSQINSDAQKWLKTRDHGYLYRGAQLLEIEEQWPTIETRLNSDCVQFYEASIDQRNEEVADKEKQLKRTRLFLVLTVGLLILAAGAAVFARRQQNVATEQKDLAIAQTTLANAQSLQRGNQLELSTLLAIISSKKDSLPGAEEILRQNVSRMPILLPHNNTGNNPLTDTIYSENGETIVVADPNQGAAFIYDAHSLEEINRYEVDFASIGKVALTYDGKNLVTNFNNNGENIYTLAFFDIEEQSKLIGSVPPVSDPLESFSHSKLVVDIDISADGKTAASGSADGQACIFDIATRKKTQCFEAEGSINVVKFSEDGGRLLTGGRGGHLWDVTGKRELYYFQHETVLLSAAFSPSKDIIATAGADQLVKVWRIDNTQSNQGEPQLLFFHKHDGWVNVVTFSPDGKWMATASSDNQVRLWNMESFQNEHQGNQIVDLAFDRKYDHDGSVVSIAFNPNTENPWLASISSDRTARLWHIETGQELAIMSLNGEGAQLSFNPNGDRLVTTTHSGFWQVWDLSEIDKTAPDEVIVYDQEVTAIATDPKTSTIFTVGRDLNMRLWDRTNKDSIAFADHTDLINAIAITENPSGQLFVATASNDKTVTIRTSQSGIMEVAQTLDIQSEIASLGFNPNSHLALATTDFRGRLIVWDWANQKGSSTEFKQLQGKPDLLSIVYHPSGATLAAGANDGSVAIWNTENGAIAAAFKHGDRPVLSVAYSFDGAYLFTAGEDGNVRRWTIDNLGRFKVTNSSDRDLLEHPDAVNGIGVDPTGAWIATAGEDGTLRLWNTETWKEEARVAHHGPVTSVSFSADGKEILTASENFVFIWHIDNLPKLSDIDSLIEAACKRVAGDLNEDERTRYIGDVTARSTVTCE